MCFECSPWYVRIPKTMVCELFHYRSWIAGDRVKDIPWKSQVGFTRMQCVRCDRIWSLPPDKVPVHIPVYDSTSAAAKECEAHHREHWRGQGAEDKVHRWECGPEMFCVKCNRYWLITI